jgi:hypothetical protein
MSSLVMSPLIALDDHARTDHPYLSASDCCWCLSRYIAGPGYRGGSVNQLIANLKCAPTIVLDDPVRRTHKQHAIEMAAEVLRRAVSRDWVENATWIPIPPSRAVTHVDYDDRLARVLRVAFTPYDADVRVALYQQHSQPADHLRPARMSLQALYESIRVNLAALAARPLREHLMLFDDVLTTGKHYRCCERRLHEVVPGASIAGLFLARRALSARGRRVPRQPRRTPLPR